MNLFIACLLVAFIAVAHATSVQIEQFAQNNTGPLGRARLMENCYPAMNGDFAMCIVASGLTYFHPFFPSGFHQDIWRMDIDYNTATVQWYNITGAGVPYALRGGYHQFWQHNLTAFSFVGGLNDFNPATFQATCNADNVVTYDYTTGLFETYVVPNGGWGRQAGGACDRYYDAVYCWGGFSCDTFQDKNIFTKYNLTTKVLTHLNAAGLTPRHHSSINCIEHDDMCIIGSGDKFGGGTSDEWNIFDIESGTVSSFTPTDKPVNTQYISVDLPETWDISSGNFQVTKDGSKMLVVGGDLASGASGTSNTIRYVAVLNRRSLNFKQFDAGSLFTIKAQYARNIPKLTTEPQGCNRYVEYGGFEDNAIFGLHYPNVPVMYTVC